jgi:hypothetical protein
MSDQARAQFSPPIVGGALTIRPSRKLEEAEVFANRLDVARPHQARTRSVSIGRSHQFKGGIVGRSSARTSW